MLHAAHMPNLYMGHRVCGNWRGATVLRTGVSHVMFRSVYYNTHMKDQRSKSLTKSKKNRK